MDRLTALATFKCVVDNGGFARAALDMNVSCAKVSRTVQDLETLLGVQLLQRTTRRIALTSVGQEVLSRAVDLLDSYDQLASVSSLSASEPAGPIRIAAPAAFARRLLSGALADFMSRYPRIEVNLHLRDGLQDIFDDEVDMMLCMRHSLRPTLIARHIGYAAVGLYAAASYLDQTGTPQEVDDLLAHNCLSCSEINAASGWRLTDINGAVRDIPVRETMRCTDAAFVADTAIHGAGIAMLPHFMVKDALASNALYQVLPEWTAERIPILLAWGSRRNLPQRVRKLIDHLAIALGTAYPTLDPVNN